MMNAAQKINIGERLIDRGKEIISEAIKEIDEARKRQEGVMLTQPEVAAVLGLSERHVRRLLKTGKLKSTEITDVKNYKNQRNED